MALIASVLAGCGGGGEKFDPRPSTGVGLPTGRFAGQQPKGLVVFVHEGSWTGPNPQAIAPLRDQLAPFWRSQGYATLVPEYRAGAKGLEDVTKAYDRARRRLGAAVPACGLGRSAGGQILLELAIARPELRCVVSLAGPTDLEATKEGGDLRPLNRIAVKAFGREDLAANSPALRASRIKAKVFQVFAENDRLVPPSQAEILEKALPGTRTTILPGDASGVPFVHSTVPAAALQQAQGLWSAFIAQNLTRSGT